MSAVPHPQRPSARSAGTVSGVRPGPGPISDLLVDDHTDSIAIEPRLEGAARVRGAFSVLRGRG